MSVFRELIRSAIDADLGKNDLKVFIVLLEQTLGYGKKTDRLTDRRLSRLCGMRLDRFRSAAQTVVNQGLFDQRPAKMFQYRYTIGEQFLTNHIKKHGDKDFFTPTLPKKRGDFQKTDEISEKQTHTSLDLNPSLSSHSPPLSTLLAQSFEFVHQQTELLASIFQAQNQPAAEPPTDASVYPNRAGNTPVQPQSDSAVERTAAASETPRASTAPEPKHPEHPSKTMQQAAPPVMQTISTTLPSFDNITAIQIPESLLGKHLTVNYQSPLSKTDRETDQKTETQPQEEEITPSSVASASVLPLPKALAKIISVSDYPECHTLLGTLQIQQQRNVFVVYKNIAEREGVHFPMHLFRSLVTKSSKNDLILPKSVTEAHVPTHPSMVIETHEERLARQDAQDVKDETHLRHMLRVDSKRLGISVEELARKRLLSHLLPLES